MFKTLFFVVVGLFLGMGLHAQKTIISDANAERRSVGNFSSIDISGGIDLYLSQGDEDGIAVSASDARYVEYIKTAVFNGVLTISYQGDGWKYRSGNRKMVAYVSFKLLTGINASGASDIYVNGSLKADKFKLKLSGASDFKGSVDINSLDLSQSGASDATILGKITHLVIEASGASNFKGYGLEAETCDAKASGASDIKIAVSKELYAEATGASSINYKGNGIAKEVRSSGASNIRRKM